MFDKDDGILTIKRGSKCVYHYKPNSELKSRALKKLDGKKCTVKKCSYISVNDDAYNTYLVAFGTGNVSIYRYVYQCELEVIGA